MYTRCYCVFQLFAFAHRLHTRRAHATPTKPHFLLCHVVNSGTIRSTKATVPNPLMSCDETQRHVVCGDVMWRDVCARISYLWRRPAQLGDGPRTLLAPGNTELGETSGKRNFLSLTSCCLCLWRRSAQPGNGPLNAYLLSLATASATWRRPPRPRTFYLWRRPAQLGDGPRTLLTPGNTELGATSGTRNFLSLTSCCLCLWRRSAQPGDGPLNAYLLVSLATASATWRLPPRPRPRLRICYFWRRPAQLGDGPRTLLTPGNTESMMSESSNVHLSATTPHYQAEIVRSFDSKCRLLST